ncbi:cadherin-related family member 2 [Notolabrus celidotus]|uniref:cadherin-related family member 2 n=1 Tax=Notolabrus celidotus TaxID=1203425 RepID=UPI001490030E|nr:cadherin-related family member 2 [Notolabrus celidotus]XP_034545524.1 cadherin-related family member 2 [Notolabrus celidotus]XP_034545525.1 cadherin-related family member 2 [Notolabrus celidotus]
MSTDMEGFSRGVLFCFLCIICQTNANTSPEITDFVYNVCEDHPADVVAFTIVASDPDNDPLTFSLAGINAGYFEVESHTGRVIVKRKLDKESNDVMPLDVIVYDGHNTITEEINIILSEANDNRPIFQEASYDFTFPENTAVGSSLFTVKATDADTSLAGVVHYSIDEVTPSSGIGLFDIVDNTGEVRLIGNLNYTELSTFYRLKINATDGGGHCYYNVTQYFSTIVYSFITVEDMPDLDPQFLGVPYVGRIEENSPLGKSVFQVTAVDQDRGVNDRIIYSIEDATVDGLFDISSDDGIISVLSEIDREEFGDTDTVTLTVKATESKDNIHGVRASTTTNVLINIIDVNDNPPQFYKCGFSCVIESHFTEEVSENSLGSISINMTVRDLDKISNTKLTLGGADKDVFSVEPQFTMSDSIVQLLVRQPQKLDFEKTQQMIVEVIATDQGDMSLHSTATVTIIIMDTNDNSPEFPQPTYRLNVTEHSEVGTVVANITAEDPDTMDQGKLTYSLLPDSILLYFDVEKDTGVVRVKDKALLDREVRSLYSATLQARDTDEKPGSTVLEINVLDINDQPPVISRDSYLDFVKEGGTLELKIEATDADDPDTENSQIVFSIEDSRYSDLFTIDPNTGVLRNSKELDREALDPELGGRIELNVTATDKGIPRLSTTVPVIINVEDVNDNIPEFAEPSYQFYVKEGEKGAFVGSVTAMDLDQTRDFNRISFSIVDGSFGSFIIRTFAMEPGYRGNITVDPEIELDYESEHKRFTLRVEAVDLEQSSSEVIVVVHVEDVNDERPEIMRPDAIRIKENTTYSQIGEFLAHDTDGNHSLVFQLKSIQCRCNGSLTPCNYVTMDPTGMVSANPEITMDYEQCDQVLVEAQVVDEYTEKGENYSATTETMEINIDDINDNIPEFLFSDSVFVVVSESASKGTSVAGVTATDRDSGINRQIEFEVTAVQFKNSNSQTNKTRLLFEAVTTQQKDVYVGIIQTTEALDVTLKGKYLVTVTATDTGGLFTSTVLEIFTVDDSYRVELEFTPSEEEVEEKLSDIIRALTAATKTAVEIVSIRPNTDETSRASSGTIIVVYFVYANGTALTSDDVEKMISDPDHYFVLEDLGLANIGTSPVIDQSDPLKYGLYGMLGGLIVVLAILTTSLMCTRRNFKRKLKAAKAMNSAAMVNSDNQKIGYVVPGTNKYNMEGANPVLNLNIDSTLVLDLDLGEEESSDVDKVSLNSLDCSDDMAFPEKDTKPIMNMIQEEEEEENGSGPPEYIEPLGAVLAQRGQKRGSENPRLGYSNPAFSTTDL